VASRTESSLQGASTTKVLFRIFVFVLFLGIPVAPGFAQIIYDKTFAQGPVLVNEVSNISSSPLSAVGETEAWSLRGDVISRSQIKIYRDSQGRIRLEYYEFQRGEPQLTATNIQDPVAGFQYALNPYSQMARRSEFPKSGPSLLSKRSKAIKANNPYPYVVFGSRGVEWRTEYLGTQLLEGLSVQRFQFTDYFPAATISNDRPIVITGERWYSDELDLLIYSENFDPRFGQTIHRLTNIDRSEPDASLFRVPPDHIY